MRNSSPLPIQAKARKVPATALLGVCVWLGSSLGHGLAAQDVTFIFNPPVNRVFVVEATTKRSKYLGNSRQQVEESSTETRYVVKRTPAGYRILAKTDSAIMTRDGKAINDPLISLLLDVVVTYEVDAEGQLLSVKGLDKVEQAVASRLPPVARQALAPFLSEEALVEKEIADWNTRIGSLAGRIARLGDTWVLTDEFIPPGGEPVSFYAALEFVEEIPCGETTCILTRFFYNSDPVALQQAVGKPLRELADGVGATQVPEPSTGSIIADGERLIDPRTMLIYQETLNRKTRVRMHLPGQAPVWTTLQEKKEYRLRFD